METTALRQFGGSDEPWTELGAKATNLHRMCSAGIRVPRGGAVVAPAFPDSAWALAVAHAVDAEFGEGLASPQIVRSSGLSEDGRTRSLAGSFLSIGGITDESDLCDALVSVANSLFSSAATKPGGGVIVQEEVAATVGGVLFTADPLSGDPTRYLVEASSGGPRAVVGGSRIDVRLSLIVDNFGQPTNQSEPVNIAPLTGKQIRNLCILGFEVTSMFGIPQDIEFAFDSNDDLWALQARPITWF